MTVQESVTHSFAIVFGLLSMEPWSNGGRGSRFLGSGLVAALDYLGRPWMLSSSAVTTCLHDRAEQLRSALLAYLESRPGRLLSLY